MSSNGIAGNFFLFVRTCRLACTRYAAQLYPAFAKIDLNLYHTRILGYFHFAGLRVYRVNRDIEVSKLVVRLSFADVRIIRGGSTSLAIRAP